MTELNPFVYGEPVAAAELIDRRDEVERLVSLARGGHNTRLSAPRRYGKTSLLRRVLADATDAGLTTVYVDFYGVATLEEVADRIEDAYRRSLTGRLRRTFDALLAAVRPTGRVTPVPGLEVEISPTPVTRAAQQRLLELLDLPARLHERSERRTLVVFDEFQEVLTAGATTDRLIRSRIQHHGPAAAYIFAGSHPGLMAELFDNRERALFGQARPVELAPLPGEALVEYIGSRFEATQREPGPALVPLTELARGHPQRAMLLAHHLWENTPEGVTADEEGWLVARSAAFGELRESFEREWSALGQDQKRLLDALATGEQSLFARATLDRFQLTKGGAQQARTALLNRGVLSGQGSQLEIVDPLLAAWIAGGRRTP